MAQAKKTILDVLLEKNRITGTEAGNFDKKLSNAEIEKQLRKFNLASSEDIAKAYGFVNEIPYIDLQNVAIPMDILGLIPANLIQKYRIVAFQKEGQIPGGKIKLAIGNPADLKKDTDEIIDYLKKSKNLTTELYITTPESIDAIYSKLTSQSSESPSAQIAPAPTVSSAPIEQTVKVNVKAPTSELKTIDLKNIQIPYEVVSKFPIEVSTKYNMVVFENPTPSLIKVAVSDPYNTKVQEILDFVREKNEIAIEEFVASPKEISEALKMYYIKPAEQISAPPAPKQDVAINTVHAASKVASDTKKADEVQRPTFVRKPEEEKEADEETVEDEFSGPEESNLDQFLGSQITNEEMLRQVAETGNVPKILAATISLAVCKKASDIHIEPEEDGVRVRLRVDGVLKDAIKMPLELSPALISRIKILSRLKIDEQRVPQDGRFDVSTGEHQVDLRVSTLPTVRGEKAAIRILDKTQSIFTLEELGINGHNLEILQDNIKRPYGVILATGPTGSGKSTTLYSILKQIASPDVNVITLEDPVEYELPGINQCQVKPKIGFSFAEGLRSVLRQDPNIIMVGEIRDAETAGMATHAALTGHLVLSTLHTNDAAGALPRLINMGIEPFLITSSINAIVAQRLVRKVCPKCNAPASIPEALMKEIETEIGRFNLPKPYKFIEGKGCAECNQGYSGRIGIYEVLQMSEKIEELAVKKRPASEINQAAVADGMVTLKQDGLLKAAQGLTSVSEVLRVTTNI